MAYIYSKTFKSQEDLDEQVSILQKYSKELGHPGMIGGELFELRLGNRHTPYFYTYNSDLHIDISKYKLKSIASNDGELYFGKFDIISRK